MPKGDAGGVCGKCGHPLKPNAKFCGGCGTPVSSPAIEASAVNREAGHVPSAAPDRPRGGSASAIPEGASASSTRDAPERQRATVPSAEPGLPPASPPSLQPAPSASSHGETTNHRGTRWLVTVGVVALLAVGGVITTLVLLRPSQTKTVIIYSKQSTTTTSRAKSTTTTGTGSSHTSTPALSARQEAGSLNALLINSSSDRAGIVSATSDIANCGNLSQDQATLQSSGQSRQSLLQQLSQLDTAQLPNATQLVPALTAAWQASLQADNSYAAWASDLEQSGCADRPLLTIQTGRQRKRRMLRRRPQRLSLWPCGIQLRLPTDYLVIRSNRSDHAC